jgi:hypothetical protein
MIFITDAIISYHQIRQYYGIILVMRQRQNRNPKAFWIFVNKLKASYNKWSQ